jgi:hypothetical protein
MITVVTNLSEQYQSYTQIRVTLADLEPVAFFPTGSDRPVEILDLTGKKNGGKSAG